MTLTRAALEELTSLELRPAVSILMSTHRAGRDVGQDWIRLKNLLRDVERQLEARDLPKAEVARLLAPGHELVDDRAFWRHQDEGFAVYAAPNFFRSYRCPERFRELAVVAESFHVTQLFPLMSADRPFYVLALSQNDVRLIRATRTDAMLVDLGDLPRSLPEALLTEPPGQELQQHVVSAVGAQRLVAFHGHGPGLDHRKDEIRQFFHRLDRALRPFLPDRDVPLVLAAVDYLIPIYHEANSHRGLLPEAIHGNPEGQTAAMLGSRAWELVRGHFDGADHAAVARYEELAGSRRVSSDVPAILRAAHEGRASDLFLAPDARRWGRFEPESGAVTVRESPGVLDEDLLNLAAIHVFKRGGIVHVVAREHVPGHADIAAIFRY
jgi:hypothetical protein